MPTNTIRIRATLAGDKAEVKALIKHQMETGQRKDEKTGQPIPAWFIQEVTCELNGKPVLNADWGVSVSKDPYISFELVGAKAGDKVKLSWKDSKGETDSAETEIKAA